eukprot:NODE_116_length_2369_cov_183.237500_g93_i0.p5 GENE.NODE_116_length_2369_cov_183.237500_g93_i0~~NODE_116_length_2369_cov_183.237500_g93_i0.p5  ORF type:complete len:56 (-),score=3.23 NODE_116_length_2369_cov_183.237500_g93_i0:1614-1781(-)
MTKTALQKNNTILFNSTKIIRNTKKRNIRTDFSNLHITKIFHKSSKSFFINYITN